MNTQFKKRNLIQFYLIEPIFRQNSLRQLRTKPTHHYNDRTRNTKEHNQQDYLFLYKSKGQHLLTNQRILDTIVRKSSINPTDTVLEIGPGTGNLTLKLLNVASKVVAVEIDKRMVEVLNKRVKEHGFEEKLSVIREDALKAEFPKFDLVVANIPYGISSPLVAKLVYGVNPFRSATLLLQKEFARRLLAKPGDSEFNRLAVNVKMVADVEFVMNVSKRDFLPAPKVDSSVVIIRPKDQIPDVNLDEWWAFTKTCFGKKNKTLGATFKQKKKVIELFRLSKMASSNGEEMNRNQYVCADDDGENEESDGEECHSSSCTDRELLLFKEKIIEVLKAASFEDKRPSKLCNEELLYLLSMLNQSGIYFHELIKPSSVDNVAFAAAYS
ncbi:RIBOSOMAL RNA SMALL SUBUNIT METHYLTRANSFERASE MITOCHONDRIAL [Salix purpurea]|uniref:rRNA adenine N(6)-methyltransferase n=1 Tax=Salix purpurea TaxID=77065 RepID=A0A9Q0ZF42_SALPP|nr:RIBOSOMAL RNA SMALL SUBUNIT METHYLTRANSFERASE MITOCHONDRIAL [Salix purpurea]